jgi:hypothetical protein
MSRQRKVEVEISGGVATVVKIPKDVTVEIRDYDTEGCDCWVDGPVSLSGLEWNNVLASLRRVGYQSPSEQHLLEIAGKISKQLSQPNGKDETQDDV